MIDNAAADRESHAIALLISLHSAHAQIALPPPCCASTQRSAQGEGWSLAFLASLLVRWLFYQVRELGTAAAGCPMKAFVAYLRVSTSRQGERGLGIEAQRAAVSTFARQQGADILAEYVEVETGKGMTRSTVARSSPQPSPMPSGSRCR
jgi:resolvase-like protein